MKKRKPKSRKEIIKAIEASRAYNREWAKRNRLKVKASQFRYWMKRAEEMGIESTSEAAKMSIDEIEQALKDLNRWNYVV